MTQELPSLDIDLWSDEALADPYPGWRRIRDTGPVVYLPRYDVFAVTRYDDVKAVLQDWETFSSARGVAFNQPLNDGLAGSLIGSDPPDHVHYRKILERPLSAAALRPLRDQIRTMAAEIVSAVADKDSVEAVSELASRIPLLLVRDLVGLPADGQERMLEWAAGGFNALAPLGTPRVAEGMQAMADWTACFRQPGFLDRVRPDSWASKLRDAADAGEITHDQALTFLQMNYTFAALDTTIHTGSNILWLLATHPDVWAQLRSQPSLIGRAINEALRLDGPVQTFSRFVTRDTAIGGSPVKAGERLLVAYGAANRDERHYPDPDRFDIYRDASDHLAFGFKEHRCLGQNLALLEIMALVSELVDRFETISVLDCRRDINNSLRGFQELTLRLR